MRRTIIGVVAVLVLVAAVVLITVNLTGGGDTGERRPVPAQKKNPPGPAGGGDMQPGQAPQGGGTG